MVVFVDLEGEDDDPIYYFEPTVRPSHYAPQQQRAALELRQRNSCEGSKIEHRGSTPLQEDSISSGELFASALGCYPIAQSLASRLDLNDLYSLSATCRPIHQSLNQFARQLRLLSLRCVHEQDTPKEDQDAIIFREPVDDNPDSSASYAGAPAFPIAFHLGADQYHGGSQSGLGLRGKISACARDMVAPCRRCGVVVCRNCAAKPPSDRCLPNRFRRLCKTCLEIPLEYHLQPLRDDQDLHDSPPASSASSTRSLRSSSSSSSSTTAIGGHGGEKDDTHFTALAFLREPCSCKTRGVYLCHPCGQNLNAADTTYKRVWTWRSRYSTHIGGGLGTGLGGGNQGQKCGRGENCLEKGTAGVCWVEIECSEARAQNHRPSEEQLIYSRSSTPSLGQSEGEHSMNKPGYLSQEMEGIGGVVKKKVKKRVKVGATVWEYDDERESSKYLEREASGRQRGWCGWCSRVCLDVQDRAEASRLLSQP